MYIYIIEENCRNCNIKLPRMFILSSLIVSPLPCKRNTKIIIIIIILIIIMIIIIITIIIK